MICEWLLFMNTLNKTTACILVDVTPKIVRSIQPVLVSIQCAEIWYEVFNNYGGPYSQASVCVPFSGPFRGSDFDFLSRCSSRFVYLISSLGCSFFSLCV